MLSKLMSWATVRKPIAGLTLAALTIGPASLSSLAQDPSLPAAHTRTPIQHVVVIFQENVSFDHYFATYPKALNPQNEPQFHASQFTPSVNGLSAGLLTNNPNSAPPFRLDRSQAATCDQDHDYTAEQQAFDAGLMDKFPEFAGQNGCDPKQVMGYFDGNTVTAMWNYAQYFSMSDNSFNTTFGPSTPGALNLVSGQTHGYVDGNTGDITGDVAGGSVTGDPQPFYDDCSTRETLYMTPGNKNIGDLLNARMVTWGFFQGGFKPSSVVNGKAHCDTAHIGSDGKEKKDYIPHHEPFQYYASTANPHHLPPSSVAMIGKTDQANHQYDLSDFWNAVNAGNMPEVTFLKAPGYLDGHAGYSDPLAEQKFIVNTINALMQTKYWNNTAILISYDDSDGWYDHVMSPILKHSTTDKDALTGPGACGGFQSENSQGRCGYGPRLPLLLISPYSRQNFVDHTTTDQSSILRFIEDNWFTGRIGNGSYDELAGPLTQMFDFNSGQKAPIVLLDPNTGEVVNSQVVRK